MMRKRDCGSCTYFQLRTIHSVPVENGQGFCKKHSDYLYDWNYCEDYRLSCQSPKGGEK